MNRSWDEGFTNHKVIVARSYPELYLRNDPDPTARDHDGHGTATAMCAAGVSNTGPLAVIAGVAIKAYLGSYKVFGTPGYNDSPSDDLLLKAVDDAVADGMDVINMSLGTVLAPVPDQDVLARALERAAAAGVIVSVSAGNSGPDPNTISSPATSPAVISVGASSNDRLLSTNVNVEGLGTFLSLPSSTPAPAAPVSAPLADVASLDGDGLACNPLPAESLTGRIALILRGTCYFEAKLLNAQQAGAVAALVYSDAERPDAIAMAAGTATLPAEMVSYPDGAAIKARLGEPLTATLQFIAGPVYINPDRVADFSSRGPNVDGGLKPDLLAVGTNVYTAAQRLDPRGVAYSSDGYASMDGTSFSSPIVAGAAALLKAARPGLTVAQYRSLLINSAGTVNGRLQQAGAGVLNLDAAVRSTLAAAPVSLSFGSGGPDVEVSRTLTLANVGTARETYVLSALPRDGAPAPALPAEPVELDPGASIDVKVSFSGASLQPGEYEGVIAVQGVNSGIESRIPYWYAVGPAAPRNISVLWAESSGRAGATLSEAFLFRATDGAGLLVKDAQPQVSAISGAGSVLGVTSMDDLYPGVFAVDVRMGNPGSNVFRIQVGDATREVTVVGR